MSEIRQIIANKDTHRRQGVNFTNAAGDVCAKKNSTHHKTRNNIPKNLRYDLENALVGLCDVWFEEIKPYLVRNNIKVHGDAGGDLKRSASPDCNHIDPGRSNHQQQSRASYVDSSLTQQTASKAPCLKQVQRHPRVLAENQIITQSQSQRHNVKKETVKKPRKRRKWQPQTQPRQLIPRLCRTISWQQYTEVYPKVDPMIKTPLQYTKKFSKEKYILQTADASTQTEKQTKSMKKSFYSNMNPKLLKLMQRPATTTISYPKKNKECTEIPLFQDDLMDIIAEKHNKMLKVLYTSPRKEECPSVMNLFSPSNNKCQKSKGYNRIPPWK
ncbi:unnamed protein product [Euphydryas editha]|uniref:Uncharacterized protein n=1 Tax=Euphydryas editha TaxID=104508 RepID=A0AAU9UTC7_EUPED|nr:unnamed protein product [Euphydryas editha]